MTLPLLLLLLLWSSVGSTRLAPTLMCRFAASDTGAGIWEWLQHDADDCVECGAHNLGAGLWTEASQNPLTWRESLQESSAEDTWERWDF